MICELYHDNFQNFKRYNIPKTQLVIADIPYNLGINAYASNPEWYVGGDNNNGESTKAAKAFFNGDGQFKIAEYMHFCNKLLIKEPKERVRREIRIYALLSYLLYKELLSASIKSEYEDCRSY